MYIEQCLRSLISQITDFPFEILVADDLSHDRTREIITKISQEYPNLVRPLFNDINLGVNLNLLNVMKQAKGEYIALCEGDDYWSCESKIKLQANFLDRNHECSLCVHPCLVDDGGNDGGVQFAISDSIYRFGPQDVLNVSGQFAPTASYMFKAADLDALPNWFGTAPVGDFFMEMYYLTRGFGAFLPEVMSVYRVNALNSWSLRNTEAKNIQWMSTAISMRDCIRKMRQDPRFANCDFNRKESAVCFNIAVASLMSKNYPIFKVSIYDSWKLSPRQSLTQTVLRALWAVPQIAGYIYGVKRRMDRIRSR
jgi:glycosyltransferase involved in cell wall biosynthesis